MYANATMSREGLQFLDSIFFERRSKTVIKGKSWYATQHNPEELAKFEAIAKRLKTGVYQAFQLWRGTVNQFRPAIAKWIYTRYTPTSICDFSAGWGGRCLGAIDMQIPYTGIDSNVGLKECYDQLLAQRPGKVQMHFQPAESFDFSTIDYDMIFTSPPYFMLERYECMPSYASKEEFLTVFFRPVIQRAWEHLKNGGHMCLNMPESMYTAIEDLLPVLKERLEMPKQNRFAKTSTKRTFEYIYVWQKKIES